jgi:hypothetical protein
MAMTELEQTFHEPDENGNVVDPTNAILASGDPDDHADDPEHPAVGNDAGSAGEVLSNMGGTGAGPGPAAGPPPEQTR